MFEILLDELTAGLGSPDDIGRVAIRLGAAMLLGAIIGLQREVIGAAAGLRTHMLVALAATVFVLVPPRVGMSPEDLSRVIQGVATGIGFIGAGAILKLTADREIYGLTTAASVWITTAVGLAVGLGHLGVAVVCAGLAWIILSVLPRLGQRLADSGANGRPPADSSRSGDELRRDAQVGDESAVRRAALLRRHS